MPITTTLEKQSVFGNLRVLIHKHTTPGTNANEIVTGADSVLAVFGNCGGAHDITLVLTPNTSDDSTEALGSFSLHSEGDETCWTVAFVSG